MSQMSDWRLYRTLQVTTHYFWRLKLLFSRLQQSWFWLVVLKRLQSNATKAAQKYPRVACSGRSRDAQSRQEGPIWRDGGNAARLTELTQKLTAPLNINVQTQLLRPRCVCTYSTCAGIQTRSFAGTRNINVIHTALPSAFCSVWRAHCRRCHSQTFNTRSNLQATHTLQQILLSSMFAFTIPGDKWVSC